MKDKWSTGSIFTVVFLVFTEKIEYFFDIITEYTEKILDISFKY